MKSLFASDQNMELVTGQDLPTKSRIVDEQGEIHEFDSKETIRASLKTKFEENQESDQETENKMYDLIYGSTQDTEDPDGLDSNKVPGKIEFD